MSLRPALATLLIAAAMPIPAWAADLQKVPYVQPLPQPVPSWTGAYLSAYGLYGANLANTTLSDTSGNTVAAATNAHGPGAGGSLGYNFQVGAGVLGLRTDLAWLNMTNTGTLSTFLPNATNPINYIGDVDLLLGIPLADGKLLAYGVGGFAYGGVAPTLASQTLNTTPTGWNVGAGMAYQLLPNWQLFMEGDYYQLDGNTQSAAGVTAASAYHIFTAKSGITYKF